MNVIIVSKNLQRHLISFLIKKFTVKHWLNLIYVIFVRKPLHIHLTSLDIKGFTQQENYKCDHCKECFTLLGNLILHQNISVKWQKDFSLKGISKGCTHYKTFVNFQKYRLFKISEMAISVTNNSNNSNENLYLV